VSLVYNPCNEKPYCEIFNNEKLTVKLSTLQQPLKTPRILKISHVGSTDTDMGYVYESYQHSNMLILENLGYNIV